MDNYVVSDQEQEVLDSLERVNGEPCIGQCNEGEYPNGLLYGLVAKKFLTAIFMKSATSETLQADAEKLESQILHDTNILEYFRKAHQVTTWDATRYEGMPESARKHDIPDFVSRKIKRHCDITKEGISYLNEEPIADFLLRSLVMPSDKSTEGAFPAFHRDNGRVTINTGVTGEHIMDYIPEGVIRSTPEIAKREIVTISCLYAEKQEELMDIVGRDNVKSIPAGVTTLFNSNFLHRSSPNIGVPRLSVASLSERLSSVQLPDSARFLGWT